MKKLLKILGILLCSILLIIIVIITYVKIALPDVGPAPELTVDKSPANVERGRYLANSVMSCMDCHSKRDVTEYSMPMVLSTRGQGGERFDQTMGFPGVFYSANITPDKETGIGSWTREFFIQHFAMYRDSAAAHRAVNPGELQTMMPWTLYCNMTDSDLSNIYTYIQTIQPIKHSVTKWKAGH
ncbi:MAG TPA: hypothetical protein VK622_06760 [Puia sp.]|nr:hypothetical protein [Puia sp.]